MKRTPTVHRTKPQHLPYSVGDRVLVTGSVRGRQGQTGTIVAVDLTTTFYPLEVEFRDGVRQLHAPASLRYVESGAR